MGIPNRSEAEGSGGEPEGASNPFEQGDYSSNQIAQDAKRNSVAVRPVDVLFGDIDCNFEDLSK